MLRLLTIFARLRWRLFVNGLRGGRQRDKVERVSRLFGWLVPALITLFALALAVGVAVLAFFGAREVALDEWAPGGFLLGARLVLFGLLAMLVLVPIGGGHGSFSGHPRLLLLPIPRRVLFAVEGLSSLADPWTAFALPALVCTAAGFASGGRLSTALVASCAGIAMLLALASIGSLFAFLTAWLMRDRRRGELVTVVVVLAVTCIAFLPMAIGDAVEFRLRTQPASGQAKGDLFVEGLDSALPAWTAALPSELYARSIASSLDDRPADAWLALAGLLGQALVFGALGARVHARLLSASGGGSRRKRVLAVARATPRIPGLSPAASAVAWTQARTALRSVRGRVVVLMPGPIVLLFGLLSKSVPEELPAVLAHGGTSGHSLFGAGMMFGMYALLAFVANMFATDRAGLTLQFLSPISDADLVRGKCVGCGLVFLVTAAGCLLCALAAAPGGSPFAWIAVLGGGIATYALLCPLGAVLSAYLPVASDLSKTGNGGNPHGFAFFLGAVAVVVGSAPAAAILWLAGGVWKSPALAAALMLVWMCVAIAIAALLTGPIARAVTERRENLGLVAQSR
ncbi:MAG: hypothetical protein ACKVWV_06895 [Planctomycetota bacterium]